MIITLEGVNTYAQNLSKQAIRLADAESNMHAIAHFLKISGLEKAQLLPYNPLWHEKNFKIGKEALYSKKIELTEFMDAKKVEKCKDIFRQIGIGV